MSELSGNVLPGNLVALLDKRPTTVVVATVDDDGWPHAAPYNLVYAPDDRRLWLAVNRQDVTLKALRDYGLTMIEVLEEGDIAVGIKGRARVIRDRMEANCNLCLVEVDVVEVKRDNSPHYLVAQGIRTRLREEPYLLQQRLIFQELKHAGV
ncbi:MAG: pyridoxamine 5'-phosphate oxidase family protein [Patescibacteria group bacterium]